ncbi:MAG: hypothetical protein ACLRWP_17595 [Bilophila wadsworthia]
MFTDTDHVKGFALPALYPEHRRSGRPRLPGIAGPADALARHRVVPPSAPTVQQAVFSSGNLWLSEGPPKVQASPPISKHGNGWRWGARSRASP